MQQFKKILIIRTDRFGEVLLNIPAVRAVKETFPGSLITMVVSDYSKDIIAGNPDIDEIIMFDIDNLLDRLKFIFLLKKEKFDLAIILNPSKFFNIATFLAGIKRRVGYDRKWGFLLTDRIKDEKFRGLKHEVEYNLDLVSLVGAHTDDKSLNFTFESDDEAYVKAILASYGASINNDLLIAIHPASSNPAKMWPEEYFVELIDAIKEKLNAVICIIGTQEQSALTNGIIQKAHHKPLNLCGRLTLKQLGAFFKSCKALISNDSGPVHLAAAVGTPTVVMFGRNMLGVSPKRWGPWKNRHIVFHKDPGCNPCLDRDCPYDFKCLRAITPQEVFEATKKLLSQP